MKKLVLDSVADLQSLWLVKMMRGVGNPNLHDWEEIHTVNYDVLIRDRKQYFDIDAFYSPFGYVMVCRISLISKEASDLVLKALGGQPDSAPNSVRGMLGGKIEAYKMADVMCKELGTIVLDMITKYNAGA